MHRFLGMLLLPALLLPTTAPAQIQGAPLSLPAPATATTSPLTPQIQQLQRHTRSRMLAALSSANLLLLSRLIGALVIEQTPDVDDAAARLNAALSPAESRAVLAAQNDEISAIRQMMRNRLAQLRPGFRRTPVQMRRVQESNAGLALLRSVVIIGSYK